MRLLPLFRVAMVSSLLAPLARAETPPEPLPASAAPPGPVAPPGPPLAAEPAAEPTDAERLVARRFLHGFRLGYGYIAGFDQPASSLGGASLKEKTGMKTPHHFLLGYEGMLRMVGHSWLNVVLVGNVVVAGLEQSKFLPVANGLIGFEIDNSFQ